MSSGRTSQRVADTNVEIIGKGYKDERASPKQFLFEPVNDKPPVVDKPQIKTNKGKWMKTMMIKRSDYKNGTFWLEKNIGGKYLLDN